MRPPFPFCSLIVVASDVRDLNARPGGERGAERGGNFSALPGKSLPGRGDWLALRAFVAFNNENHPPSPSPFSLFFSSSFSQYIPSFSRSNALKLETILFEIVLPPRYLYGGRGIGRHEGPESWVFRLDDCCRCWEKNCCAIMAQFLAGIRNYSTELKETVRRGRRREKERSARINEKLDAKWRGISIVSSMILCARGERERENGKSARIILLATQGEEGRGNTLCVYYAGITRVIKGLLTCWNTRVAMVDRRYLSIY